MSGTLPDGLPEYTLGWGILQWSAKYLKQPDGVNAGDRWLYTDSQARFVLWLYAVDEDGRWLYRRACLRWSKGRGKSPMLAALCLAELCGPVRFSHWDDDGQAVGMATPAAWVQIAATAEWSTVNTMSMVLAMCPKGSRLQIDHGLDPGRTIIHRPGTGSRLEVISASARSAEGNRPTFVVMDETQEWGETNGGHALAETLRRNLGKMRGRSVEACNAHAPGTDSIAEGTYEAWLAQTEGRAVNRDILYDAIEAPPDTSLTDPVSLRAGLEVCYADAPWQDLDRIMAEIWDVATPVDKSRRYYLNQIVAAEDSWVSPVNWDALAKPTRVVEPAEEIALFFDGSKSRDATALVGCAMSDGHVFTLGVWEPDQNDDDDVVPVVEIELCVARTFAKYRVVGFFADVQEWQGQVITDWPRLYGDQLLIWAMKSGKQPTPIAWDMRTRVHEFTLAVETAEVEILDKRFTHDGDSRLARHVYNAKRRPNNWGISIGKETRWSPRKIDAAVCMAGVRMVRRLVLASDEWEKYERRKRRAGKGKVVVLS